MNRKNRSGRGFTLIELLVVITIIGMLAAILIPAITGALRSAKKARAMSQVRDLDGAIKRYYSEYGKMPVPSGNGGLDKQFTGPEQGAVVEILINASADTNLNHRKIVFLDLDPASFGVKTIPEMLVKLKEGYKDPWGNFYGILMDLNFDEKITGSFPITLGSTTVNITETRAKVGTYSVGDPKDEEKGVYGPPKNNPFPPFKTW